MADVMAPMVGKVISVDVKEGDVVKKNDVVAVLEAMKMQVKVFAPQDGTVKEIKAAAGDTVSTDNVLVVLE